MALRIVSRSVCVYWFVRAWTGEFFQNNHVRLLFYLPVAFPATMSSQTKLACFFWFCSLLVSPISLLHVWSLQAQSIFSPSTTTIADNKFFSFVVFCKYCFLRRALKLRTYSIANAPANCRLQSGVNGVVCGSKSSRSAARVCASSLAVRRCRRFFVSSFFF